MHQHTDSDVRIKPDYTSNIRHAVCADMDSLCRIEHLCFDQEAFPRRVLEYLATKAHGALFVVDKEGVIIGYISLVIKDRCHNVRIYSIAVDPAYRGHGEARRLVEQAINYARTHARTAITLEVRCDNTAAIALYKSYGFRTAQRLLDYYHAGVDGFRMRLEVPPLDQ